jgi:predicted RNA binding protein YcfA (HicA-like mRNA interferase family)
MISALKKVGFNIARIIAVIAWVRCIGVFYSKPFENFIAPHTTEYRYKGSHHFLIHSDGRRTVVPVHGKETIGWGLLAQILRDCKLTLNEFLGLL